jgi:hypothetical protein
MEINSGSDTPGGGINGQSHARPSAQQPDGLCVRSGATVIVGAGDVYLQKRYREKVYGCCGARPRRN